MKHIREEAVRLRMEGYSYSFIGQKTNLSLSMLSYYLKDIAYTPNTFTQDAVGKARTRAIATKAKQRQESQMSAYRQALKDIGMMRERDLFMLGLGVYIGEGSKTQNIIRVVNSDYKVINIFIRWLKAVGLNHTHFKIRIHLYPDSDVVAAEQYWMKMTGLPKSQFQKACIDRRINKDRKRSGTHIHGTAHVTVCSNRKKDFGVPLARKIAAWMEIALE
jgi:hypothetical protein